MKMKNNNLDIIRGEMTRPEIWLVWVTMEKSLASLLDLIKVFPSTKDIPDNQLFPKIVYSGSQNRKLTLLKVFDLACKTPGQSYLSNSSGAQRFHSCAGKRKKKNSGGFHQRDLPSYIVHNGTWTGEELVKSAYGGECEKR